jgi:hypothetical protein
MKSIIFLFLTFSLTQEIPYKPKEEFEVKLDYQFKQRPREDRTIVHVTETNEQRKENTAILPFLVLNVNIITAGEATRLHIGSNMVDNLGTKKLKDGTAIPIEFGFTDDVKDRVTPHEYTLTFLSSERKAMSKIVLFIAEDGTFLVNGERRGRF